MLEGMTWVSTTNVYQQVEKKRQIDVLKILPIN